MIQVWQSPSTCWKKKSSSETQKLLLPSFLSKWCKFQIQMKASNREHEGKILLLFCLKGKQQLPRYAKATNSQWNLMLLKTHIAPGQMVGLCSVLHWEERFTVQQELQDDLAPAELWFQGNLFHHHWQHVAATSPLSLDNMGSTSRSSYLSVSN